MERLRKAVKAGGSMAGGLLANKPPACAQLEALSGPYHAEQEVVL